MYAKIASITPLMKGTECPPQISPPFIWNYNDHFDLQILENLHEWFQEKIKGSLEYKEVLNPDPDDADFPKLDEAPEEKEEQSDLPF
jgi:hypothetical protein